MEFASKFIYANDADEYESLSEEEFVRGMQVSESESSDSEVEEITRKAGQSASPAMEHAPVKKKKVKHHWKRQPKQKQGSRVSADGSQTSGKEVKSGKKSRRWFRKADTNVVSVNFSTLLSPSNMHAGEPVICNKCSALLSHLSKVDETSKVWQCEFCGEAVVTDIEPEEIPKEEDVTYLLEPAMTTSSSTMSGMDQSLVIFCVDTSGSMCVTTEVAGKIKLRGTSQLKRLQSFNDTHENQYLPSQRDHKVTYISRLQAMQAAVDHQLGEMATNHPNRRVALVSFNNEVTVYGDGNQSEITIAGDKLASEEELSKAGSEAPVPQAIKGSRKILGKKVYHLEEGGATALGPALVVAVNMAAHHPGSKVILCTDGKANVGMGKLEDVPDEDAAYEFYNKTAESALRKGVTISVITIQGTDCKLVHLGMLADKTGGQVNIVDPLKLTEEFGNILTDPVIATKVKATFILHKELYVVDATDEDKQLSRAEHHAGNVKKSTTITFEFSKRKPNKAPEQEQPTAEHPPADASTSEAQGAAASEAGSSTSSAAKTAAEFPFQLQIEYVDTEGNKALRVLTRAMPATSDRDVTEEHANLEVLGTHAAKKTADLALQGQYSKSRGVALMNQRLAWRQSHSEHATTLDRHKYKNIYSRIQGVENCVGRMQMSELDLYGRTRSDSENDSDEDMDVEGDSGPLAVLGRRSPLALMSPRPKARSKGYIATKFKKMRSERTSVMDDDMANMMYRLRNVDSSELSAPPRLPQRPGQSSAPETSTGRDVSKTGEDKSHKMSKDNSDEEEI